MLITVNLHFIGHQRIQPHHITSAVADNLCVGIAVNQQVAHQRFTEDERRHFGIWLVMEQKVKRVHRHSLFSVFGILIQMQGQLCNGFRKHSHTGIHNGMLHGTAVVHSLAAVGSSEEIGVGRAVVAVLGLIS